MGKYGEPWSCPGNGNVVDADGELVASFPRGKGSGASTRRDMRSHRTWQCVNALASMPDPAKGVELAIAAMKMVHDTFSRTNNSSTNWLRDDEHEAWQAVIKALRACGEHVQFPCECRACQHAREALRACGEEV